MTTKTTPRSGYAELGDLRMYYEIHGSGGTPLLLLHGGLFDIELQFGHVLDGLAAGRQVVAVEFQGHGHTNDIDRPLSTAGLTEDVVGLLAELALPPVDVFGFSVGGAVALRLAIEHPELVRRVVVSSVSFSRAGMRDENSEAVGSMTVDMIAGTPMEAAHRAKSPNPDKLQDLLDKLGGYEAGEDWSDDAVANYPAPTLFTLGDNDAVQLEHALRFLRLRGGDVNGDFAGVPASHLAVFPGSTHFSGMARADLVVPAVTAFLDADSTSRPGMVG